MSSLIQGASLYFFKNKGMPYEYEYVSYRQVSNIRRTLVGNTFVDHSDVVGASPVGDSHLHSRLNAWHHWIGQRQLQDEPRNT